MQLLVVLNKRLLKNTCKTKFKKYLLSLKVKNILMKMMLKLILTAAFIFSVLNTVIFLMTFDDSIAYATSLKKSLSSAFKDDQKKLLSWLTKWDNEDKLKQQRFIQQNERISNEYQKQKTIPFFHSQDMFNKEEYVKDHIQLSEGDSKVIKEVPVNENVVLQDNEEENFSFKYTSSPLESTTTTAPNTTTQATSTTTTTIATTTTPTPITILLSEIETEKVLNEVQTTINTSILPEAKHTINQLHSRIEIASTNITTLKTNNEENIEISKQLQQCIIPKLNPFHPDVLPYISYKWKNKCNIKRYGKIVNGSFQLKLQNVQRAGFYYIRRDGDMDIKHSTWNPLMNDTHLNLRKDYNACLLISEYNELVIPLIAGNGEINNKTLTNQNVSILTYNRDRQCLHQRQFFISKEDRVVHLQSSRCFIPREHKKRTRIMLSENNNDCSNDKSKFQIYDGGIFKHVSSGKCIKLDRSDESLTLQNCNHATRFHFAANENVPSQDIDVTQELSEDYIRVEIIYNNNAHNEYHMHVTRDQPTSRGILENVSKISRDENKLNIIMLMVDSLSHANAERVMNRTYKFLKDDPYTTIMQGHTIVGDGTTPQLCVILLGAQEHDLPEARRGFPNSKSVDRWPFIFSTFEKSGYKTIYSEDEPWVGTFQYRLHGFDNPPTTKYLRPWWLATSETISYANMHSHACPHEYAFDYIKGLYHIYQKEKKFGLFVFSNLAHSSPNRVQMIDNDFIDLFTYFNESNALNNTAFIIFGDHGARNAEYRATIQGKLEERLPLLSITLPKWFHQTYPEEVNNLKENAKVLTSHYDIHATLKHLLSFPNHADLSNVSYGRSLFTDITSLNRSCADAGVDSHWCPCLDFENVNTSERVAINVGEKVVEYINSLTNAIPIAKEKCSELSLKNIIRVSRKAPKTQVQQFVQTFRDKKCDACGVKMDNTTVQLNTVTYEIVLSVYPSNGEFEATVDYHTNATNHYIVHPSISRINKYGDQPKCVASEYPYLRKFCYCKD